MSKSLIFTLFFLLPCRFFLIIIISFNSFISYSLFNPFTVSLEKNQNFSKNDFYFFFIIFLSKKKEISSLTFLSHCASSFTQTFIFNHRDQDSHWIFSSNWFQWWYIFSYMGFFIVKRLILFQFSNPQNNVIRAYSNSPFKLYSNSLTRIFEI